MGQAWCKEKTSKAQDSKSPLDRVFVRCAHRIYPGLKEEGSVLGGATQRVTSSEIGYAGSPPREALTRGRSIDSVDRPFHPSDWVDMNLEVPSTPRASSVLTNLTVDTSLYPATTPTSSSGSNLKDVTPVPPPRRRKRNRGRPLPPKPDEIPENTSSNSKHTDVNEEPLYSSVKLPRQNDDEGCVVGGDSKEGAVKTSTTTTTVIEDPTTKHEGKRTKEIYEHKVNGTGRIIPSDVVSGKRSSTSAEKRMSKATDSSHHRRLHENEEYERFVRGQPTKDSSTPNRQDRRSSKELERKFDRSNLRDEKETKEVTVRTKNYSTVSLPNYDELDAARYLTRGSKVKEEDDEEEDEENEAQKVSSVEKVKSKRPVRCSTVSLPAESFLSPFSQKTSVRLEDYVPRRGSVENLLPFQVLGKLSTSENGVDDTGFVKYDPSKLEDWDLSDISNCELNHRRRSFESASPVQRIFGEDFADFPCQDVVDSVPDRETGEKERVAKTVSKIDDRESVTPVIPSRTPQKPEAFGKTPSACTTDLDKDSNDLDSWIVGKTRSANYFDPPTMETCRTSPACESDKSSKSKEPFYLNERNDRMSCEKDTIGGSCKSREAIGDSERSEQSRTIFGRRLSNESEPYDDLYESKDLNVDSGMPGELIRTISEESLPREMLHEPIADHADTSDDFFEDKLSKDMQNKMKKDRDEQKIILKTPPSSPEPKITAEILDNDHSILLKVLKDETAEESNLSSMTPSLTELEAALSDMLEKEEPQDRVGKREEEEDSTTRQSMTSKPTEKPIEPKIVPIDKDAYKAGIEQLPDNGSMSEAHRWRDKILVDDDLGEKSVGASSVSLGQILDVAKSPVKTRKVSFCAWEETRMAEVDLRNGQDTIERFEDVKMSSNDEDRMDRITEEHPEKILDCTRINTSLDVTKDDSRDSGCLLSEIPEKPSRLHRSNLDESLGSVESVPTPPRRRHRSNPGISPKDTSRAIENGTKSPELDSRPIDRLI